MAKRRRINRIQRRDLAGVRIKAKILRQSPIKGGRRPKAVYLHPDIYFELMEQAAIEGMSASRFIAEAVMQRWHWNEPK